MLETDRPSLIDQKQAIDWACQHFPAKRKKTIRDQPWSKIHMLASGSDLVYLKVVPPQLTCAPRLCVLLAEHFPGHVPALVASDAERGLLLMRPHNGRDLTYNARASELTELLITYARMQVKAAAETELMATLPEPEIGGLLERLLEFLEPDSPPPKLDGAVIGADYFLDAKQARGYHAALLSRQALLEPLLGLAAGLPTTLNHGDLRPPNAALTQDGRYLLYDWDDAVAGPAGMSLHGLFSGCATPTKLLAGDDLGDRDQAREERAMVEAYIGELAAGGYAGEGQLRDCLAGSMCAGMLQFLLNFSKFPMDSKSYQRAVRKNLQTRLGDLLDLCDFLALQNREQTLEHAQDYCQNGLARRAEEMLQRHLWHHPNDADAHLQLAAAFRQRDKRALAIKAYRVAAQLQPDSAAVHAELGACLQENLELDQAITCLRRAHYLEPASPTVQQQLDDAFDLKRAQQEAQRPDVVPALAVSERELAAGKLSPTKLALAVAMFREHGVVMLENLFERPLIEACHDAFLREYQAYFEDKRHGDALNIGDKRFQVTLAVREPMNAPAVYANPLLMPLLQALLDDKFVIGSYVSATSLPGSDDQRLHKDHPSLFGDISNELRLPTFAVNTMIPMVDLTPQVGTTKVRKGSHVISSDDSKHMRSQAPFVAVGSCYLMDYRLSHRGEPNRSNEVRPILSIMYQRPWFRDHVNFKKQPPFRIDQAEFDKVPDDLKRLFAWALQPTPYQAAASPSPAQVAVAR